MPDQIAAPKKKGPELEGILFGRRDQIGTLTFV